MALPEGITPKTVTVGIPTKFNGTPATGSATLTAPKNLKHVPTGTPLFSGSVTKQFKGLTEVTFTDLTPTDAAGLNRVDWTYTLTVRVNGAIEQPEPIHFPLPEAGPDTVDADLLVEVPSSAGTPISALVLTAENIDPLTADFIADPGSETAVALATASVAAVQGKFADLDGFFFDPMHPTFGAVGDGTTDDTTAVKAAVAAAKAVNGCVVFRRMFLVNDTIVQDDDFALIGVGSNVGLKAGASMPANAPLLWTKKTDTSTAVIEGHMYGAKVDGIRLDGNARTVACKGWQIDVVTGCDFRNVQIRHFAQEGMLLTDSVRESDWYHVHVRGCGDAANGYAAVAINHSSTKDGHNNLHFYGLYAIFSYGLAMQIRPTNETSPTRGLVFDSPMFHGMVAGTTTNDDLVMVPDWRHVATPLVEIADARTVLMNSPRLHRSGYGQPLMLIRNNELTATTQNSVSLITPSFGTAQDATGTVTATAATDLLTATGIKLGTGAIVRFTTTGTLPAGLSLLTDYYAIRVSDNTFKVATTRALAEAGTAVDITSTGTGTHTVTAQSMSVLMEAASNPTLRVVAPYITDDAPIRPVVVNKAGNGKVILSATGTQSGVTFFEPFSATDSATGAFSDLTSLSAMQTSDSAAVNNSNVLVTSGVLALTLDAGATYAFDLLIHYDCTTVADLKLGWAVPTSATGYYTPDGLHTSVSSNSGTIQRLRSDLATSQAVGGAGVGTTVTTKVTGTITTAASGGTFALKYAQNTADATDLIIRAGSYFTARRIA